MLGDIRRMPELSPELVRMIPLKKGGLRPGQWYVGVNRRKGVLWPTRSVVADVEPGRLVAWDTKTSGARWIWELSPDGTGTRVVHRRPVPRRLTAGRLRLRQGASSAGWAATPTSWRPGWRSRWRG